MIYTFYEQLKMSLFFIIIGIFLSIMLDTINTVFKKIKPLNYIMQFISWISIDIVCIKCIDNISNGYVPIYLILFFLIGYIIYVKLFQSNYIKIILKLKHYEKNIILAIFPVTMYNYFRRKLNNILRKRKQKYEKNNFNDSNTNNNGNDTGM